MTIPRLRSTPHNEPVTTPRGRPWTEKAACVSDDVAIKVHALALDSDTKVGREAFDEAKTYCVSCPVRQQCLDDALASEAGIGASSRFGIWGGLTPNERAEKANGTSNRMREQKRYKTVMENVARYEAGARDELAVDAWERRQRRLRRMAEYRKRAAYDVARYEAGARDEAAVRAFEQRARNRESARRKRNQ